VDYPEAWAVVRQVMQEANAEGLKTEKLKKEEELQNTQNDAEAGA